ncbi:MAG: lytic transglycosylase domain-containing protein [Ferruginibacter sp.]|nr:lytic transglycosylase domain-containing protein [Ferruginibacter sp.]
MKKHISTIFIFTICKITFAQNINTTTNKILFASNENKIATSTSYITKAANIVFPNVLKGNEEQTIDYIEKFAKNRREYLVRMNNKSKKYFPKVSKILSKKNLAKEYQVLLALESAFNGNVVSSAGAVGYWQIMDEVAQEYGLTYEPQITAEEKKKLELAQKTIKPTIELNTKKNAIKDDRKNFIKSTNAAARYLKDRTKNLNNNMLLIVASYNCGVGNVWSAIKKSGVSNASFWDIKKYLPQETQTYVMNFITLNVIFNNYQKFANNTLTYKAEKIKIVTETRIDTKEISE